MYACQVSPSVSRDQHTALPLVGVLVTWYGRIYYIINIYIKNEKLSNSNYNRRKPKFLRLLWDIIIFRLVAYLLNMICLKLQFFLQNFININFRINSTQICINFSRQEHPIELLWVSISPLKCRFQPIPFNMYKSQYLQCTM